MKKSFKNLFLLLLLPFCLACTKEDDPVNFEEEIVGTWLLTARFPYGLSDCYKKNNIEFQKNGNFILKEFIDDLDACVLIPRNGKWSLDGNKLKLDVTGTEGEETAAGKVAFSENNTVLKISYEEITDTYIKQ